MVATVYQTVSAQIYKPGIVQRRPLKEKHCLVDFLPHLRGILYNEFIHLDYLLDVYGPAWCLKVKCLWAATESSS